MVILLIIWDLTLSHYKNKIVSISDNEESNSLLAANDSGRCSYTRATKGTSYPEFYGLIVDGYFPDIRKRHAASYPEIWWHLQFAWSLQIP